MNSTIVRLLINFFHNGAPFSIAGEDFPLEEIVEPISSKGTQWSVRIVIYLQKAGKMSVNFQRIDIWVGGGN